MKRVCTYLFLTSITLMSFLSCEKEELDPSLPPIIELSSSLDAENRINKMVLDGSPIEFLIDFQEDKIWRACYETGNYNNVFAYGIEARVIIDNKQKKVDKKLRNVVTVYSGSRFKIYGHSDFVETIYNTSPIRFHKVTLSKSQTSPDCKSLNYYFLFTQQFGGAFLR